MVQTLPSAADVLQQPLEDFAKGFEKLLAPNMEFQKAMQKAIGANPDLAQQLADLEYNAPGTLNRMGFGHLGQVVSQIPESPSSKVARAKRGTIEETLGRKADIADAESGFDLTRLNKLFEVLHGSSGEALLADDVYRLLTGQTADEHKITKGKAEVAEAEGKVKVGQARAAYDQLVNQKPGLAQTDFLNVARDFLSGRADGKTVSDIMSGNTPGAADAFNAALKSVEEERHLAMTERIADRRENALESRLERRQDASDEKAQRREANQAWLRSGMVSTVSAWETMLNEPEKLQAVRNKMKSGTLLRDMSQDERDLLRAGNAADHMSLQRTVTEGRQANLDVNKSVMEIRRLQQTNAPESEIETVVGTLQDALNKKGRGIQARYGPPPNVGESQPGRTWTTALRDGNVYYVGPDGKRIADADVFKDPTPTISGRAMEAYTRLQGEPEDVRYAALAKLQTGAPAIFNELAPYFDLEPVDAPKPTPAPPKPPAKKVPPPVASDSGLPEPTPVRTSLKTSGDTVKARAVELAKQYIATGEFPSSKEMSAINSSEGLQEFSKTVAKLRGK